ncbi:hypothetical protein G9A89_007737 [Geosiphon pyriformis]|nr:hypothetical protein G9A89_007737 [Geosiphon pyriformis]
MDRDSIVVLSVASQIHKSVNSFLGLVAGNPLVSNPYLLYVSYPLAGVFYQAIFDIKREFTVKQTLTTFKKRDQKPPQRFNIPNGIKIVKRTLYLYIENCISNYLLGNYNISEYCKKNYPVQSKYSIDFELETETNNKNKQKLKQHLSTTPNTPKTPKITAKYLQTSEPGTSTKLPLSTPNSPLIQFSRPEDFTSPKSSTQQQEPISTSTNLLDYLQKNENNYSESLESEETESKQEETIKNKEEITTAYIAKIPEFTGENNDISPQE